ncbi:unnamed protein product [Cutaneotrichosporon oleaginosum]
MCISTRHALPIAGSMAWIVQRLVWLTFPVSWPASKLLGFVLGQQKPPVFHRFELRELIRLHHTQPESQLGDDTFQLTWNALTLSTLTAKAAMVPLEKVFMLPWDKDLDYRALCNIHEASWSRIVVYNQHEDVQIIYGYILSRSLILHNPHKRISLQKVPVYELPYISVNEPLTNVIRILLDRQRHMALVHDSPSVLSDDDSSLVAPLSWRQRLLLKIMATSYGPATAIQDPETASNLRRETHGRLDTPYLNDDSFVSTHSSGLRGSGNVNPIGIITLEDVLEKVLSQTIRDETDGVSWRYPRTDNGGLNRSQSLPSRRTCSEASIARAGGRRPSSGHYPSLATVDESISATTAMSSEANESRPSVVDHSPANSLSTEGSDGLSTRRSYRSNGKTGLRAVYIPRPTLFPDATDLTGNLKRNRSNRRHSRGEGAAPTQNKANVQ